MNKKHNWVFSTKIHMIVDRYVDLFGKNPVSVYFFAVVGFLNKLFASFLVRQVTYSRSSRLWCINVTAPEWETPGSALHCTGKRTHFMGFSISICSSLWSCLFEHAALIPRKLFFNTVRSGNLKISQPHTHTHTHAHTRTKQK